ncbi:MAG: signal peptidase II [Chloroflexi bacterium]|nr:signal peptidase II [Chloroflexota bacterium]
MHRQGFWHGLLREAPFSAVVLLVVAADQLSKYLVARNMELGESFPSTGLVQIHYTINTGTAFGLFPNQTFLLTIASFAIIGVLLLVYRGSGFPGALVVRLSISLQLGGAIGNLIDRLWHGYVIDFIALGWWPVFNLADASIVTGVTVLAGSVALSELRPRRRVMWPGPPPQAPSAASWDVGC